MDHLLEIKKLNIAFKTKKGEILNVLNNVSFTINQGEVLGLVGESHGEDWIRMLVRAAQAPTR